jgi:MoaA/NifB/PqqE/SkfB family radical SAM enzyme
VSFILLAGGEPLLRKRVIDAAGEKPDILFPVFTNGTFMGEKYFELFDRCRNIVPIMSIEGNKDLTDARRGEGVYDKLISNMDELNRRGLIFGASVTVTTDNYKDVSSEEFIRMLSKKGCKAVIFVEYVPVTEESADLAPGDFEREYLTAQISQLRTEHPEMVFVSFPGDEKSSGGCIAAGRGFFHINSHGGAEPCPFSPYSDTNVRDMSLREAMNSKLFKSLIDGGLLQDDHKGGCVLFERRDQVTKIQERLRA